MSSVGCLSWRLTGAATAGASTPHGWARAMAAWSVNVHIMNKITLFPVTGQRGWGLVADIPRLALGQGRPGAREVITQSLQSFFWAAQNYIWDIMKTWKHQIQTDPIQADILSFSFIASSSYAAKKCCFRDDNNFISGNFWWTKSTGSPSGPS